MPHNNRLLEALNAFLKVSSLKELENVLKLYPELLSEDIDSIFAAYIEKSREQGEEENIQFLEQRYQILYAIRFQPILQQAQVAEQRYLRGGGAVP